jgi:fatty acid desaturase
MAFVPGVLLYFLFVEIVNLPHHLALSHHHGQSRIAIWNQHENSRSCSYPRWLSNFIFLNFNYHIEHHLYPDLPWFYLEELQTRVSVALGSDYHFDPMFQWIISNRRIAFDSIIAVSAPTAPGLTCNCASVVLGA